MNNLKGEKNKNNTDKSSNQKNVYEKLELNRVINGSGKMTALGVSKVDESVIEKMASAGQNFVVMDDLLDRVGEELAKLIGSEDVCVTSSASAGIALSIAGLIAKDNLDVIENLFTRDDITKREVIIQKGHAVNYGAPVVTMINLGGGKAIEVGQSNKTEKSQIEARITKDTVALLYIKSHHCVQKGMVALEDMIAIGKANNVPVIVDAAAEEDLKIYIKKGADLVIYSGAKAICGPASGLVAGKKEYTNFIKKQYLGIGRGMKIGKMAMIGLLEATKLYLNQTKEDVVKDQMDLANLLIKKLASEEKITTKIVQDEAGREIYRVQVALVKEKTSLTGEEFLKELKSGKVEVHVRKHYANLGIINIDMRALNEAEVEVIANKIKAIIN